MKSSYQREIDNHKKVIHDLFDLNELLQIKVESREKKLKVAEQLADALENVNYEELDTETYPTIPNIDPWGVKAALKAWREVNK